MLPPYLHGWLLNIQLLHGWYDKSNKDEGQYNYATMWVDLVLSKGFPDRVLLDINNFQWTDPIARL